MIEASSNTVYKRALVMCLANPSCNPRPRRAIELLSQKQFHVSVLSYPNQGDLITDREFVISPPSPNIVHKFLRLGLRFLRKLSPGLRAKISITEVILSLKNYNVLAQENFDIILVENLELLPLALRIKGESKIIFDAREFYPKEFENNILFELLESKFKTELCRKLLKCCDAVITVSPGLAQGYMNMFNIDAKIIRSVPTYVSMTVNDVIPGKIKMVHHGGANRDRNLENMIELFKYLDERFSLDFYLTGNEKYRVELTKQAKPYTGINFCNPVPFEQIVPMLNKYDLGLYLLEPTGFNTKYSLPNKLFEFIQARVMVAIGPSPDMAALVQEYQCGIVSDSFEPKRMAKHLNQLKPEQIMNYKANSNMAAKTLCFEEESNKLQEIIFNLLKDS